MFRESGLNVELGTVDAFQGREKLIVIGSSEAIERHRSKLKWFLRLCTVRWCVFSINKGLNQVAMADSFSTGNKFHLKTLKSEKYNYEGITYKL